MRGEEAGRRRRHARVSGRPPRRRRSRPRSARSAPPPRARRRVRAGAGGDAGSWLRVAPPRRPGGLPGREDRRGRVYRGPSGRGGLNGVGCAWRLREPWPCGAPLLAHPPTTTLAPMGAPIWIVIPTYNEAANLERSCAPRQPSCSGLAPGRFRILVVDDNSPDGTGAIADELASEYPPGRGAAPPGEGRPRPGVPRRVRPRPGRRRRVPVRDGRRLLPRPALPRRHAHGRAERRSRARLTVRAGRRVRDWGLLRRADQPRRRDLCPLILGVSVRDLTGGFKCIRRQVLESIDLPSLRPPVTCFRSRSPTGRSWPVSPSARYRSCSPTARAARARCPAGSPSRRCCWCPGCEAARGAR